MSLVDVNSSISYEVTDHLAGTSYHKVQISNKKKDMKITSWISYWKHHTGLPLPRCCPGNSVDVNKPAGEQQVAHELHSVVGAHVRIKDTEGNVRFGIVPACKTCNNWENEFPLVWQCKAVTLVSNSRFDFVGKIQLTEGTSEQLSNPVSSEYWVQIDLIQDLPPAPPSKDTKTRRRTRSGGDRRLPFSITGLTNKSGSEQKTCVYNDPDDFLHLLSIFMRSNLRGEKRSLKNDANFVPEIIVCNVGKLPMNSDNFLKEREPEMDIKKDKPLPNDEILTRRFLSVSYCQKDVANEKFKGEIRWDPENKAWYCLKGSQREDEMVKEYGEKPTAATNADADIVAEAVNKLSLNNS